MSKEMSKSDKTLYGGAAAAGTGAMWNRAGAGMRKVNHATHDLAKSKLDKLHASGNSGIGHDMQVHQATGQLARAKAAIDQIDNGPLGNKKLHAGLVAAGGALALGAAAHKGIKALKNRNKKT